MSKNKGLFNYIYPECMITEVYQNANMDNFLFNRDKLTKTKDLIYTTARIYHNEFESNSLCIDYIIDHNLDYHSAKNESSITKELKEMIFKSPYILENLLKRVSEKLIYGYKIQVPGNYRNKRIDIVILAQKTVYLIHLIRDTKKLGYYIRSYEDVKDQLNYKYNSYDFQTIILSPIDYAESRVYTIEKLIKLIGVNYGNNS